MKNFFISSTFTDMQEERDFLRSEVFPRLSQEAFQHGEDNLRPQSQDWRK